MGAQRFGERSPANKKLRVGSILAAARDLAPRDGVRRVTLAEIADVVGMHKSAILRYFETREEVYLELAADEWRSRGDEWQRIRESDVDAGATILSGTLGVPPMFCDLLMHAPLTWNECLG